MPDDSLAALEGARKQYGKIVALDGLDLLVRPSELLAVLGPNGAGKSTAIGLLLGLVRPDGGRARLLGRSPQLLDTRREIGVMMQEVFLAPELRVGEQIDLVASYYPAPLDAATVLAMTHLGPLADRPYGKLSGGQKRQVQLAIAVCGRPRLLFLDEPTAGLDLAARELMWALLRRLVDEGASILLTTHYLEEAEALADRVVVLSKGRAISSGTVGELRALVTRKQIRCATRLTVADVAGWPDVLGADVDHERLFITTHAAEDVVRRLLGADPGLAQLEVKRAGLAEAFRALTDEVSA